MVKHLEYGHDSQVFPPALANSNCIRAPRLATLDPNYVSGYVGGYDRAQLILPPAVVAGTIPGNESMYRALPRTMVADPIVTSSPVIKVKSRTAMVFRSDSSADSIRTLAPFGTITLSGTFAANDTITYTLDGNAIVFTVKAFSTLSELARQLTFELNRHRFSQPKIKAVQNGAVITVYSKDLASAYTTVIATSGSGGVAASGAALANGNALVGTVLSVAFPSITGDSSAITAPDEITLAANAAIAVPKGVPVGNPVSSPVLGVLCPQQPMDLAFGDESHYSAYTSATLYEARVPYWDGECAAMWPEIQFI